MKVQREVCLQQIYLGLPSRYLKQAQHTVQLHPAINSQALAPTFNVLQPSYEAFGIPGSVSAWKEQHTASDIHDQRQLAVQANISHQQFKYKDMNDIAPSQQGVAGATLGHVAKQYLPLKHIERAPRAQPSRVGVANLPDIFQSTRPHSVPALPSHMTRPLTGMSGPVSHLQSP